MEIMLGTVPNDDNNDRAREELGRLKSYRPDIQVREVINPPFTAETWDFPLLNVGGINYFGLEDIHDFVEQEIAESK